MSSVGTAHHGGQNHGLEKTNVKRCVQPGCSNRPKNGHVVIIIAVEVLLADCFDRVHVGCFLVGGYLCVFTTPFEATCFSLFLRDRFNKIKFTIIKNPFFTKRLALRLRGW